MTTHNPMPVLVFGGSGYVAGEVLRLLAQHPVFRVAAVYSTSQAGVPVAEVFPHLHGTAAATLRFAAAESLGATLAEAAAGQPDGQPLGAIMATPHGATAPLVQQLLHTAEAAGCAARLRVVDLSADFRFADPARYEAVYRQPHPAAGLLARFARCVPEHWPAERPVPACAAQPGCFVTTVVLAAWPLLAAGLVEPSVFVGAVTGSSGSGRSPRDTTHHPQRANTLFAYSPLAHRHEAEMRLLLAAANDGTEPEVEFVPHSGPFVRGIHATLRLTLRAPHAGAGVDELLAAYRRVYGDGDGDAGGFVAASAEMPRLTDVVGTNRCRLGVAVRGRTVVVTSVLDNLVKGAAGGGVQWLNRLCGLPSDTGLRLPGLGWY